MAWYLWYIAGFATPIIAMVIFNWIDYWLMVKEDRELRKFWSNQGRS